jgi:hypothetical protein
MNKIYFLLVTGAILFSLTTYNLTAPMKVSQTHFCDANSPICVYCPLLPLLNSHRIINAYTYVVSQGNFTVLASKLGFSFKKALCRDYLSIVTPIFTWQSN